MHVYSEHMSLDSDENIQSSFEYSNSDNEDSPTDTPTSVDVNNEGQPNINSEIYNLLQFSSLFSLNNTPVFSETNNDEEEKVENDFGI